MQLNLDFLILDNYYELKNYMITKPKQNNYKPHELREIVVQAIRQNLPDVTQSQIADILGIARPSLARIEKRVKRKSVADKVLHNLAIKAIKENLKRQESVFKQEKVTKDGIKVEYEVRECPTYSNQLEAAKMVLDRAEPLKQDQRPSSISFIKIDIHEAAKPQDIDITPLLPSSEQSNQLKDKD